MVCRKLQDPPKEDNSLDVVTLCQARDIQYDIAFLAPVCDMRRLTWEEEEEIRMEKRTNSAAKSFTIYYDRQGNPFRKIIVQPILQADQDGTCKSRAFAVLGWLLRLDEATLNWYVKSNRELFQVEVGVNKGNVGGTAFDIAGEFPEGVSDEDGALFGSLMSTGRRDKFGRDVHLKVCHVDTLRFNQSCSTATHRRSLIDHGCSGTLVPSDSKEGSLRLRREAELSRIREVARTSPGSGAGPPRAPDAPPRRSAALEATAPEGSENVDDTSNLRRWRTIEDHEARWHFLEETCFFGHNIGFKKIPKLYHRDEVLVKVTPTSEAMGTSRASSDTGINDHCWDNCSGFGATKYLRKYRISGNYITHEADPIFHQPIENFFGFLCDDNDEEVVTVPFYVLPFPACFVGLSLDDYIQGMAFVLALEGDPEEHRRQKVSDFFLPSGDNFLNDPASYNKAIANLSSPVKLNV